MNWRTFSRCGHFVSQKLHVCEAQTSAPHHHPYPELGFQKPGGLLWLRAFEGSWGLCGALRTLGVMGTSRVTGTFVGLGVFVGSWVFLPLMVFLFFYWQFFDQ